MDDETTDEGKYTYGRTGGETSARWHATREAHQAIASGLVSGVEALGHAHAKSPHRAMEALERMQSYLDGARRTLVYGMRAAGAPYHEEADVKNFLRHVQNNLSTIPGVESALWGAGIGIQIVLADGSEWVVWPKLTAPPMVSKGT